MAMMAMTTSSSISVKAFSREPKRNLTIVPPDEMATKDAALRPDHPAVGTTPRGIGYRRDPPLWGSRRPAAREQSKHFDSCCSWGRMYARFCIVAAPGVGVNEKTEKSGSNG